MCQTVWKCLPCTVRMVFFFSFLSFAFQIEHHFKQWTGNWFLLRKDHPKHLYEVNCIKFCEALSVRKKSILTVRLAWNRGKWESNFHNFVHVRWFGFNRYYLIYTFNKCHNLIQNPQLIGLAKWLNSEWTRFNCRQQQGKIQHN